MRSPAVDDGSDPRPRALVDPPRRGRGAGAARVRPLLARPRLRHAFGGRHCRRGDRAGADSSRHRQGIAHPAATSSRHGSASSATCSGIWPTAATSMCSSHFSNAVFGWHLVAMGEPIVLVILAAAVLAAWRWPVQARDDCRGRPRPARSAPRRAKKTTQDWARPRVTPRRLATRPRERPRSRRILDAFSRGRFTIALDDRVHGWHVDGKSGNGDVPTFGYRDAGAALIVTAYATRFQSSTRS